jgi:murein endopeptidase
VSKVLSILILFTQLFLAKADTQVISSLPQFTPCEPESKLVQPSLQQRSPSTQFCREWNPDFPANGQSCCAKVASSRKMKKAGRCHAQKGVKKNYCEDMTQEQREYVLAASQGKFKDLFSFLSLEMNKKRNQAFCSVNDGFLVRGRPVIATSENRILIKSPERCLYFGTDVMTAMLEWTGREIGRSFSPQTQSHVRLVIGDVSAPRGGCVIGRSGRRAHASHTSGQDADIGFLSVRPDRLVSHRFVREFDPAPNWWLLKKILNNPVACIKAIFLDRSHIKTLNYFASKDPDWQRNKHFIRHMPGHKNHFHVRVGAGAGKPGCGPGARPDLETEFDASESDDDILEQLRASSTNFEPFQSKSSVTLF